MNPLILKAAHLAAVFALFASLGAPLLAGSARESASILHGIAMFLGPLIGSGLILLLRNWVSGYFHFYHGILGIVFIATVLWAPKGLMGLITRWQSGDRGEGA